MSPPHEAEMTSRWQGRGVVVQRGVLLVMCASLFFCYIYLDFQMRCCSQDSADDRLAISHSKTSFIFQNAVNANIRKLSSHAENVVPDEMRVLYDWDDLPNKIGRRLPHAIIIGVKKGGTRALLEILRLHPDVRAPGPETHFFDRHYNNGLEWYRKQMPLSMGNQLTMEKTPSYFITPDVPTRIRNMSKDVRLLVVVRDPVTRAVSDYTQGSSKRRGDSRTFEELAFLNISTGLVDTNWSAIRIGVYARHLEKWLKYFPLSRFHFVSGEKLITDPVSELEGVQRFLGLKPVISEHHFFFNQTKGFPCLRRSPKSTVPHCLGKTKGRSHPHIPDSAVHRLRDFYRPFNQKFYKMVGRNFNWP